MKGLLFEEGYKEKDFCGAAGIGGLAGVYDNVAGGSEEDSEGYGWELREGEDGSESTWHVGDAHVATMLRYNSTKQWSGSGT